MSHDPQCSDAESRFRTIFESEPECVKLVGRDCGLIDMNPAGLRMINAASIAAVRGRCILEVIDPAYHQAFRETVEAVFRGASTRIQFEIVGLNGKRLWMDQSAAPLFDRNDPTQVIEMVAVTRDITAQRAAEAELLRATVAEEIGRSKAEFLGRISHQLKTPLNQIIGYSELLQETAQQEGRGNDALDQQRVLDAAGSLLAMINQMLSISSLDARRSRVRKDEYDIDVLIGDAVEAIRPQADAAGTVLHVDPSPERGFWMCDSSKIDQCLRVFLANAIKFTANGTIRVKASRDLIADVSWLRLDVIDTGAGIESARPPPTLEASPDANVGNLQERDETGFGLAVARQLARLMGGDVEINSVLGKGSHFTMRVPAEFQADAAPVSGIAKAI